MTANQMNDAELAQRMGADATDEQAELFRVGLVSAGYGDTETSEIPENEWNAIMSKICNAQPPRPCVSRALFNPQAQSFDILETRTKPNEMPEIMPRVRSLASLFGLAG